MNGKTSFKQKIRQAKGKKGFTLVELVIVIAVLAIIAFIAIPTVTNVIGNANKAADASNAQSIELAIKTAQSEVAANNTNPSSRVDTISGDTNKYIETLLTTYGISTDNVGFGSNKGADALKEGSSYHFYYDKSTGHVYADTAAKVKDDLQLTKGTTKYSITGSDLTLA